MVDDRSSIGEPRPRRAEPTVTSFAVDDEPLARRQIALLVAQVPWVHHLGEAADGVAAMQAIDALRPDVLLLDIEMPELSGLQLAERLTYAPAVIFTTAHESHAVTAFELEAVDYLLKPFGRRRFLGAMERARRHLAARASLPTEPLGDAPAAAEASSGKEHAFEAESTSSAARTSLLGDRLLIRDRGAIVPVPLSQVARFEAEDDYVAVHTRERRYLIAARIADLATELPPGRFLRLHRSHIVNLDYVERMVPFDSKRLQVELRDGTRLLASRSSSEMLRRRAR
jgi:two-component system LytT family response regulator